MKKIFKCSIYLALIAFGGKNFAQITSTNGDFTSGSSGTVNLNLKTFTSGVSTARLTVLGSSGFIGLGLTSPTERLHVSGNILTSGNLTATGNILTSSGLLNVNHATNNFTLRLNTTDRLTVLNSSGNVGIGLTSPTEKLHVSGNILSTGNLAVSGNLVTTMGLIQVNSSTNNLSLRLNATDRLTILNSNGFVGIGTASPAYDVHVRGSGSSNTTLRVSNAGAPNSGIIETDASGVIGFLQSDITPSVGVRSGSRSNYDFYLATNNTNRMVIKSTGNIGINTTSPAYQLDVNGTINATGILINGAPFAGGGTQWTTAGSDIYYNVTGNVGIGTTPGSNYKLDVAGTVNAANFSMNGSPLQASQWTTNSAAINYNIGNVGIGIVSNNPAYKLDVNGTINATALYVNGSPIGPSSQWTTSGSNIYYNTSGNVGIGSASPDAKLTVNGTMHAKEVKIDLSVPGPDYVFEKDYSLISLSNLKTYIELNKHLPGVPSAKEMETNGVTLGEMNMLLLKKIEELTLYILEMKKENDALKTRVEKVEK